MFGIHPIRIGPRLNKDLLEMIQRKGARFVYGDCARTSSVSYMMNTNPALQGYQLHYCSKHKEYQFQLSPTVQLFQSSFFLALLIGTVDWISTCLCQNICYQVFIRTFVSVVLGYLLNCNCTQSTHT